MRIIIGIALFITLLASLWLLAGCGSKSNIFGQAISEATLTPIGDILAHAEQFTGKTVKVEGRIIEECPAGGWFMLKDETGIIYVNLHPSYFAIPQAIGRRTIAEGVVKKEYTQVSVIGKGVELK